MKRLISILCSLTLLLSMTGLAFATQSYQDQFVSSFSIDISGSQPPAWVQMYFPDTLTRGTYINGQFEYDSFVHPNKINSFTITLKGTGDTYPDNPIDFYLDFDSNHGSYSPKIASYKVNNSGADFTLTLDILNNALLYNGTNKGSLSWVTLDSFVGYDTFYVGYDCHFTHKETDVEVSVNGGNVPEPGTLLLVGAGLLGLGAKFRRRKK